MAVVTYLYPVSGATPPTLAQALVVNTVVATLTPNSNTQPTAAITHMFGLTAAEISQGWPNVILDPLDALFWTADWYNASHDPNWEGFVMTNSSQGIDTALQAKVTISRPHTITR